MFENDAIRLEVYVVYGVRASRREAKYHGPENGFKGLLSKCAIYHGAALTAADHAAALHICGEPRHILWIVA